MVSQLAESGLGSVGRGRGGGCLHEGYKHSRKRKNANVEATARHRAGFRRVVGIKSTGDIIDRLFAAGCNAQLLRKLPTRGGLAFVEDLRYVGTEANRIEIAGRGDLFTVTGDRCERCEAQVIVELRGGAVVSIVGVVGGVPQTRLDGVGGRDTASRQLSRQYRICRDVIELWIAVVLAAPVIIGNDVYFEFVGGLE